MLGVITGASGAGLMVEGCNSMATATDCTAQQCGLTGFWSHSKAVLDIDGCISSNNKGSGGQGFQHGHGFAATLGAVMNVSAKCPAQGNAGNGFCCESGSKMVIQQGCSALDNGFAGSHALGPSTRMEVRIDLHACRAYSNRSGFIAAEGLRGVLTAATTEVKVSGQEAWGPTFWQAQAACNKKQRVWCLYRCR
jgi:hypothetical protein